MREKPVSSETVQNNPQDRTGWVKRSTRTSKVVQNLTAKKIRAKINARPIGTETARLPGGNKTCLRLAPSVQTQCSYNNQVLHWLFFILRLRRADVRIGFYFLCWGEWGLFFFKTVQLWSLLHSENWLLKTGGKERSRPRNMTLEVKVSVSAHNRWSLLCFLSQVFPKTLVLKYLPFNYFHKCLILTYFQF